MPPTIIDLLGHTALPAFIGGLLLGFQRSRWLLMSALLTAIVLVCHHSEYLLPPQLMLVFVICILALGIVGLIDSLFLIFVPAEVASDRVLKILRRCFSRSRARSVRRQQKYHD